MKYFLVISIFLKRSLVFSILLFSSISLHWSLKKAFLSLLAILWNSAFRCLYLSFSPLPFASLQFTAICKAPSDNQFAFFAFFFSLSLLAGLWNFAFRWVYLSFSPLPFTSLFFSAIHKASSDNHFAFLQFIFLGVVLITASCTMSWTSVYSSSGTLSIRSNTLNLFVTSTV